MDIEMTDTDENQVKTTVCFVLPTYNEEAHIGQPIDAIFANQNNCEGYGFMVLVVDDNSSDNTQAIVNQRASQYPSVSMITGNKVGLVTLISVVFLMHSTNLTPTTFFKWILMVSTIQT